MTVIRWTSAERAKKMITKHRKVITAAAFSQNLRDHVIASLDQTGASVCVCPACTHYQTVM